MSDAANLTHEPPKKSLLHWRRLAARFSARRLQAEAWWVAGAYALFATIWILFSDRALQVLIADPKLLIQISVYKGLAFVMTTSLLLLILVRHYFGKIEDGYQALKAHESEIERLTRLYAALSHINQAIVRTPDRDALFQEVCEALIDHGGFRMAWIGWPEAETRRLLPVAEKGDVNGYLKNIQIFTDDRPEGQGPTGTAFRESRSYVCNDMMNDPALLPWRDEAKCRGLRASAVFPIRLKGDVCGTLTVYAGETGFFQDKETGLLEEAALDISFALDNLARADERLHMQQKLREGEDAQRRLAETQIAILNALPAHITLVDMEGRIVSVNESWRRFASANLMSGDNFGVGQNYLDVCKRAHGEHSAEASATALGIQQVLRGEAREFMLDYPCHSPGEQRWFRLIVAPLHDGNREGAVVMHINITEQRKTQEALQKSEQELRLLAQQLEIERSRLVAAQQLAKVGSWDTDLCSLAVTWSEQTHRIFETDPATFRPTHEDFLKLVHPDDREEVDKAFAHSLEQTDVQEIQHRLLMPDDRIKHVVERWQVSHDERGKPARALGTCRDITEKVLAEAEIQRTTTLLQAVAEGVPYAVFVKDLKSRYLLFNQGAARLAGKKIEDIIGRDDTAIFNPEEARDVMEDDQRVIASGETSTREEVLTLTGKTRTFFSTKAPYWDSHGKIIGIIGISRDITERKQAEERLREQATLLDKAQDAIVVRDLDHRILYWNKSAERLYGWTAQEALGRSIKELLYQDPSAFFAATSTVFEKGEWVGEIQQYNRDGKTLTIEGRWTLVRDDQGLPKSILAINTDVTERNKLKQQFLRAQRMESIGTLAGGIAHDLNNVLAPILMSIELLRRQEQDPRRQDILNTIEGSAKHGADMVRQVLSFARGVEGRQVEVQVGHLLREIEKIANETFLKTIRVRRDVPDDLWTVKGDPTQLHQVLLNLCVNARDAMPQGGSLTLSASNMLIDEHYATMHIDAKPGPHVVIKVENTGSGMSPEVLERIFDPFFTTKELGKGTGLGLSTTMAIVSSHGGFVQVQSEPGQGTQFRVFLPARTMSGTSDAVVAENTLPHGKGELVLVIDDEAAVRQITRQTLELFGYRVLLAADGTEAVGTYATHKAEISVVLTDMMMPSMDGQTTIQLLRRMNPDVRIIASSGLNVGRTAANAGVNQFIPKPYTAETLLNALHQTLHGPT